MVVTDLDGTLLNKEKNITKQNLYAIERLRAAGIYFCLCTGRIYGSAAMIADDIDNDFPIISCNGALIKNPSTNQVLYQYTLDNRIAEDIVEKLRKYDLVYHFYNETTVFSNKLAYAAKTYHDKFATAKRKLIDIVVQEDLREQIVPANGINKFILFTEDLDLKKRVIDDLGEVKGIDISQSGKFNIEVSGNGITKGTGLQKLKEIYSIANEELFVIGDEMNDLSMFDEAKFSVAMGNGDDRLKEKAYYITKSNEESVFAHAVNRIVFGEEG